MDKCCWDRDTGTVWRGKLSPKLAALLQPSTAHLPCILQQSGVTLYHLCTDIVLWRQQPYFIPGIMFTRKLVRLFMSYQNVKGQYYNL